jgi:hypothetical protein
MNFDYYEGFSNTNRNPEGTGGKESEPQREATQKHTQLNEQ